MGIKGKASFLSYFFLRAIDGMIIMLNQLLTIFNYPIFTTPGLQCSIFCFLALLTEIIMLLGNHGFSESVDGCIYDVGDGGVNGDNRLSTFLCIYM